MPRETRFKLEGSPEERIRGPGAYETQHVSPVPGGRFSDNLGIKEKM